MKRVLTLLVLLAFVAGCATSASIIPKELTQTIEQTCRTYQKIRPHVVELREYVVAHWDDIPAEQQDMLVDLDRYLPILDDAGKMVCDLNLNASYAAQKYPSVNWDRALSVVMTGAQLYVDLHEKGLL